MDYIINLLVSAGVILVLSYMMPSVHVKSFWTALWVAFLIGIFNATIGLLLGFVFNLVTLFLLRIIINLIVTALMIKLVDALVGNFKVDGFLPALIIAVVTALALAAVGWMQGDADNDEYTRLDQPAQTEQLMSYYS
ncbi:phage holin family protein [Pontibacter sp. 172403-2]|uniref:phage holin family protein n=1 Tax=Pontibacter rufus TaxID=2791028 RepID=UPI0018AF6833|nr:phage holin family protein [Pontibacter sp. 172403-2]MBF9253583.1 phage holin family protein [Pontibacter sp. 172403-2]